MRNVIRLRKLAILTMVLFGWFCLSPNFSFTQQDEDVLLKARRLYQQGYYDDAITLLNEYINKIKTVAEQKRTVAKAFYQLAKVYFTVGEDNKVEENLNKVFETYPTFQTEETDLEFKERVDKAKAKVKVKEEKVKVKVKEEKPKPEKKVIPKPVKKKKKKKFPILLVLGGLVVVGAVLYFLVFSKKDEEQKEPDYDIRGTWRINWSDIHGNSNQYKMTFSGTKTSGSMLTEFGDPGTYTVSLTNTVVIQYIHDPLIFTGTMYSNNNMGGNWTFSTNSGTWNGIKISAKKSDRQNATNRPSQPRRH